MVSLLKKIFAKTCPVSMMLKEIKEYVVSAVLAVFFVNQL